MTIGVLMRMHTAPDEVMLIYGLSYSPAMPYAAERARSWTATIAASPPIR